MSTNADLLALALLDPELERASAAIEKPDEDEAARGLERGKHILSALFC
jgi:hypothetical protein